MLITIGNNVGKMQVAKVFGKCLVVTEDSVYFVTTNGVNQIFGYCNKLNFYTDGSYIYLITSNQYLSIEVIPLPRDRVPVDYTMVTMDDLSELTQLDKGAYGNKMKFTGVSTTDGTCEYQLPNNGSSTTFNQRFVLVFYRSSGNLMKYGCFMCSYNDKSAGLGVVKGDQITFTANGKLINFNAKVPDTNGSFYIMEFDFIYSTLFSA